ncbi:MAG: hypothetical protein EBS05_17580 [Proteobacteria bacterium]|nr:hypothetical protein [Pseudomonadota bacterium]
MNPKLLFQTLLTLAGLSQPLMGAGYSAVFAFGDSLTDTGNLPAPAPFYFNGRFSNGSLWVERFAAKLGLAYVAANNRAASGSESAGALSQVNSLSAPSNAGTAVFSVWTTGNDYLNNLSLSDTPNDALWASLNQTAINNISNAVQTLYAKGARTVLVFNLPDMGRIPELLSQHGATYRSYISGKVTAYNGGLAAAVTALRALRPDLQLTLVDIFTNLNNVIANPAAAGFTVVNIGALDDDSLPDYSFNGPKSNYLFWDAIHPTEKAHALIADWAYSAFTNTPPPMPQPPGITTHPQYRTGTPGGSVTFSVVATGTELGFQWMRDGVPLLNATNATLTLAGLNRTNGGSYTVTVSNPAGTTNSRPATLGLPLATVQSVPTRLFDGKTFVRITDPAGHPMTAANSTGVFLIWSADLRTWQRVSGAVAFTNGAVEFTDLGTSASSPRRYYRVVDYGERVVFVDDPVGN